jgi:hypothetical protein
MLNSYRNIVISRPRPRLSLGYQWKKQVPILSFRSEARNLSTFDNYEISHLRFEMTEQALFLRSPRPRLRQGYQWKKQAPMLSFRSEARNLSYNFIRSPQ